VIIRKMSKFGPKMTRLVREKRIRSRNAQHISRKPQPNVVRAQATQRYPTGDVVVSEGDLAEQLRKRTETVATALNLLLGEQKVQRAPLNEYWKLNVWS
jgi:hypothetical protein